MACNLPATPDAVRPLRTAARAFAAEAGASQDIVEGVQLAVSEAVTNAVLHAYCGSERPGPVCLDACVDGEELCVEVCDLGSGMVPRDDSPGAGVGLTVIARLAARLRIDTARGGRGTCLRMSFALA